MSKQTERFQVRNSDWIITETAKDIFQFSSASGAEKIGGLTAKRLASALAVISEFDRHIREVSMNAEKRKR